ncbi:MAG TPA: hypothetical protein VF959_02310 [Casimicrobiaceae bacterium]
MKPSSAGFELFVLLRARAADAGMRATATRGRDAKITTIKTT